MRTLVPLVLLVAACGTSAENFGEDVATQVCKTEQTCNLESFESAYSDVDACVTYWGGLGDCFADNCETFDAAKGNECVAALRSADCDDDGLPAACNEAWTDCSFVSLGLCFVNEGFDISL